MPHSPRWHRSSLWVLESGTGRLLRAEPESGRVEAVVALPGFARGLAFAGPYAFVGLSKIRRTSAMDGTPLAAHPEQLQSGVQVVDLRTGGVAATLVFHSAVEEVFDVQVVGGVEFPEIVGFQKEAVLDTFVVPLQARSVLPAITIPTTM
jgi:uncharacterized protein (TIGR03032 family)